MPAENDISSALEALPDILPSTDRNQQLLRTLKINYVVQVELNMATTVLKVSTTGHIDSGKTTVMGNILKACGAYSTEQIREAETNETAGGVLNLTKFVEKGTEAKQRGMTIEISETRVQLPIKMRLAKGSQDAQDAEKYLKGLEMEYTVEEVGDSLEFNYKRDIDLLDCPGHKNYIHNTCTGIVYSNIQIVLFPANPDLENFNKMLGPDSLSIAHARLGVAAGNCMIFCLSKSETATDIVEMGNLVKTAIKKKCGVKESQINLFFISCYKKQAHNISFSSQDEAFKNVPSKQTFSFIVPSYKNTMVKQELKLTVDCIFDAISQVNSYASVPGRHNGIGTMVEMKKISKIHNHGYVCICTVINGALRVNDVVESSRFPGEKFTVTSMEQFRAPCKISACGDHIGIKLKPHNSKFELKLMEQDLLFNSYPDNLKPQCTMYYRAKVHYLKRATKGKKESVRNLGNNGVLNISHRFAFTMVHIYEKKVGKNVTTHSDDSPISFCNDNEIVEMVMKFYSKFALGTVNTSSLGNMGPILEQNTHVGNCKLIAPLSQEEGERLDSVLQEKLRKDAKKKQVHGKKK